MVLRIVHADSDQRVADSLAGFLKSQSIPVETQKLSSVIAPKHGEIVIALWSGKFKNLPVAENYLSSLKNGGAPLHMLVKLDGKRLPLDLDDIHQLDASAVGLRKTKAWRDIAKMARMALSASQAYNKDARTAYLKKPVASAYPTSDIAEAFQTVDEPVYAIEKPAKSERKASSQKGLVVPWVFLLVVLAALAAGVAFLHPSSPLV